MTRRRRPDVIVTDPGPGPGPRHIVVRVGDTLAVIPMEQAGVEPMSPEPGEHLRGFLSGGAFSIGVKSFVGSDWSDE
jgi:hypothetical protein